MAKRKPANGDGDDSLSIMIERLRLSSNNNNTRLEMTPNPMASKFIEIVPDDLLLEIFLRLPNGRCVIQLSTVCKRWRSLITNPRMKKITSLFYEYHRRKWYQDPSYFPAFTTAVLFHCAEKTGERCYQISSSGLKLFSCNGAAVRASCYSWLLLSHGTRQYSLYIPHTGQQITLPEMTLDLDNPGFHGYGLVVLRPRFSVVIIENFFFNIEDYLCVFLIFNSKTGLWSRRTLRVPYTRITGTPCQAVAPLEVAVTGHGVLNWLVLKPSGQEDNPGNNFACLVSFNPFCLKYFLTAIPDGEIKGVAPDKLRLGVVRGQLWLSRMVKMDEKSCFVLRVWELGIATSAWRLVHDVVLGKSGDCSALSVLAFDPIDGNVVYLMRDSQVYRYEIGVGKYDKVHGFPYGSSKSKNHDLRVVTLIHSLWPKQYKIGGFS